jgi:hypothetical protein
MYKMIRSSIVSLALIAYGASLSSASQPSINELTSDGPITVRRIGLDVYVGEGFALSGEPVYFAMETAIYAEHIQGWTGYRRHADNMCNRWDETLEVNGTLHHLAVHCEPAKRPAYDDKMKQVTGFTRDEYDAFLTMLFNRGFNKPERQKELYDVSGGCAGFLFNPNGHYEVAYVSKKPITGRRQFPKLDSVISIKQFLEVYDDLLMCVGAEKSFKGPVSELRGIYINSNQIINPSHKGLSLMLQGFTAAVMHDIYKELEFMSVAALPNMFGIISRNVDPQDLIEKRKPHDPKLDVLYPEIMGGRDIPCLIKIEALKRFYTQPRVFAEKFNMGQVIPFTNAGLHGLEGTHTWAGQDVSMEIPVVRGDGKRVNAVVFQTGAMLTDTHKKQTVHVRLNGKDLKTIEYDLNNPSHFIHVPIPGDSVNPAVISFVTPTVKSPAELGLGPDPRIIGICFKNMGICAARK